MRENLRLGLILFMITAIAGMLLGTVFEITKDPIAKQERLESSAVGDVLPGAKDIKKLNVKIPENSVVKEVNEAYNGNTIVGHTIKLTAKGFHGAVEMIVGITKDGKIGGIKILNHSETPGLGANIEKDSFKGQFKDKLIDNPLVVVKSEASKDNEIQGISGATISSNGVASGINKAIEFYKTVVKGEAAKPEKTKEGLVKELLPEADKIEALKAEIPQNTSIKEVDSVYSGDKLLGYAFKVATKGYGGDIETIVVITVDDKIKGIRILKHSETPGLGAEIEKDEFTSQFSGKATNTPIEAAKGEAKDNQINAISGASNTVNGLITGVNEASNFYNNQLKGKGGK